MFKRLIAGLLCVLIAHQAHAQNGAMPLALRDAAPSANKAPSAPMEGPATATGGKDQRALVERYGTVVERRVVGAGGLTAWTVEKNGRRVVLYTTADGAAVIAGVVWDAATGRNLSDQFVASGPVVVRPPLGASTDPLPQGGAAPAQQTKGALLGEYKGSVPEAIQAVDSLAGIKEGKGGQADTLYVIFDPRCPHCRNAYKQTREYVKRGFTIKWIPVAALGQTTAQRDEGKPIAAAVLQAKPDARADILRRVLGDKEELRVTPTPESLANLDRNLNFFFEAFHNSKPDETAGVPAAFFLDKRSGRPRLLTGVSERPVIEEIFGRL